MSYDEAIACESIRATLMRYTWGGDNGVLDEYVKSFTEDGILDVKYVGTFQGRDAIRSASLDGFGKGEEYKERRRATGRFSHHISSTRIEILNNNNAKCWSYFAVYGAKGPDHWGRYTDTLRKVGDRWLLSHRRVSTDGAAEGSVFFPDFHREY